jgi:hypothetical protein
MVQDPSAQQMMDAIADQLADALNILLELENYIPIIWSPTRCLNADLIRLLQLNGIDGSLGTVTVEKARRLAAITTTDLRAWRGAFRAHRAVAGALTGGQVIIQSWLVDRFVVDESTMNFVLLEDDRESLSFVYVMGQGPSGTEYDAGELATRLDDLAKPVLDELDFISCFALTAWRDGLAGWGLDGASVILTDVPGEYEAVEMGPDVALDAVQGVRSASDKDDLVGDEVMLVTAWFKTDGAASGDYWEVMAYATEDAHLAASPGDDAFVARVNVGNGIADIGRMTDGVYTSIGTDAFYIPDGTDGQYHRVDFFIDRRLFKSRVKLAVDGNEGYWHEEAFYGPDAPSGVKAAVVCRTSAFTQGRIQVAAIVARMLRTSIAEWDLSGPLSVPDLRSWWNALDSDNLSLDGGNNVLSLTDVGPMGVDVVPIATPLATTLLTVGTSAARLPGPFLGANNNRLSGSWTAVDTTGGWSVMAIIPLTVESVYTRTFATLRGGNSVLIRRASAAGQLEVLVAAAAGTAFDAGLGAANGAGAFAVVFVRRDITGGVIKVDCWYDQKLGGGLQSNSTSYADAAGPTSTLSSVYIGGRNLVGLEWETGHAASVAWWDRSLSDDEITQLAQWAGSVLGYPI